METLYYIILVPMVYLAVAVFVFGTASKMFFIFTRKKEAVTPVYPIAKPGVLYALYDSFFMPSILKHKPLFWVFLMAFHVSLLLLLVGHLECIWDISLLQVIPHEIFIGNGFVGITLTISLLYFLFRRFSSPVRDLSVPEDYFLLIFLFLVVIFGSEMDWARSWYYYDSMTVENYRVYLSSLVSFHPVLPDEIMESGHSFMLVAHVFFANLFLMAIPFTKITHAFLALPVNKLKRG